MSSDGWILYYSPEGFPYYYNEITGESQWAENEQEMSEVEDHSLQYDVKYDTLNEEYAIPQPNSDLSDDDDGNASVSESESGDEDVTSESTEVSTSATEESDGFNKEFEAYLLTPEGQRELEEERQALERYSDKAEPDTKAQKETSHENSHGVGKEYTEADDMVANAFGTSSYSQDGDGRYNPYQQQPYQDQYMQQKLQQQYEFEQYEYENQRRQEEEENSQFAQTYGLPLPPKSTNPRKTSRQGHGSSVTFEDNYNRQRYYDDEANVHNNRNTGGKYKRSSKSKSRRREKSIDDDLEGGAFRGRVVDDQHDDDDGSISEGSDSDSDLSVSSDDSDVKIIREPLIPSWASWHSLTQFVDRTVRDPVVNVSTKVYNSLAPDTLSETKEKKKHMDFKDEEGGSVSGSEEDSCSEDDVDHADIALDLQPLSKNKSYRNRGSSSSNKQKTVRGSSHNGGGYSIPTASAIFSSLNHYLSLSTVTTLFTTQQKEWLQSTYDSTTTAIWNYVTDSAEILVDGKPQRRGVHRVDMEQSQPLPP